jgi:hypothetical protein
MFKFLQTAEELQITKLENQKRDIDLCIHRLRKTPLIWFKDYFQSYPNLGIVNIEADHYRASILVVTEHYSLPPWVAQHIVKGINHVITEIVTYTDDTFRVRFEELKTLMERKGYD